MNTNAPYANVSLAELRVMLKRAEQSRQPGIGDMVRELKAELARRGRVNPRTGGVVRTWRPIDVEELLQPHIALTKTVEQNERLPETGWTSAGGRMRAPGENRYALDCYTAVKRGDLNFVLVAMAKRREDPPVFLLLARNGQQWDGHSSDLEVLKRQAAAVFTLDDVLTAGLEAWRSVVERVRAAPL